MNHLSFIGQLLRQRFARVIFPTLFLFFGPIALPGYVWSDAFKSESPAGCPPIHATSQNCGLLSSVITDPNTMPMLAQSSPPVLDENPFREEDQFREVKAPVEPVTRSLPIWGEKVREKGFDLPLPFGVGANLVFMDQGIKLRNVKVGIGSPLVEVEGLEFSDARSHDRATTARLDLWLLPFANIYGIFGYVNGESELDLDIGAVVGGLPGIPGLPPIFEPGKTIDLNIDYNGTTFGGGVTLAAGYKNFFASLDGNYTYSNIDIVDGDIETYTITPRAGVLVDPEAVPGSLALWVGAMYMRYEQTITDDINLKEIDPRLPSVEIDFKLDVKNEKPWNFLFGGQWEITRRWQFMAEGGIGDRSQVVTGLFFRF
jgi:hypothetical protein